MRFSNISSCMYFIIKYNHNSHISGFITRRNTNCRYKIIPRSFNGIVGPIYAYEGGGATLERQGVIFSNGLNGPKARLKLLVGLRMKCNLKSYV